MYYSTGLVRTERDKCTVSVQTVNIAEHQTYYLALLQVMYLVLVL